MKKTAVIILTLATISGIILSSCHKNETVTKDVYINEGWELFPTSNGNDSIISTGSFTPQKTEKIKLPATVLSGFAKTAITRIFISTWP
ncbi:hypothetical protein [Marinilabilia salmonicolor]|uniref:hypothetical protein n=1 Tax=Marinilabilia salmonicolor TaxID=989 RepID=UPI000686843C|nr:hypothetical protein [Marinilabilia salmonicolor]